MAPSNKILAGLLVSASALTMAAGAQQLSPRAHPTVRITEKINNQVTVTLPASHPQFAAVRGSRLEAGKQLPHLKLVLTSSPEQEAALQELMVQQQDSTSPNFHKWLTPESFGASFGPAQADIAKVNAWLGDQGMQVESVSKSGRVITFTGSVAQVESAFHTQINHVTVEGEAHVANTTDISIPAALSSVVSGVARLNDVFPKHVGNMAHASTVQIDAAGYAAANPSAPTPLYGAATGTHYVTPGDTAVIYNTKPLASAGIDGTGQTIAILAQTNIDVADVQKFRSMFGLPKNDPQFLYVDQDPGLNGDDGEAYLDAEWGGALAPNAQVKFIVSSPNYFSGGVDQAALYAVENNIGDIISLSYGGCEYNNGQTYTNYWNGLWEQAASQGQTVFVSSGDSGAAGCTSSGNSYASQSTNGVQYSVNSLGSSAYNVAMGGSIFVDFGQATYWGATGGTTIPFANALSYIPESPVNQSRLAPNLLNSASTAYIAGSGVFAGGGGVSIYTARPSWQTGSGIPTTADVINLYTPTVAGETGIATGYVNDGSHRLVPDLVNIAANGHDGTLYCASSLCSTTATNGLNNAGVVGGTSVATPVQAGIQALINQKNGGRQGNILPILYKLANIDYVAGNCQAGVGTAATPATLPAATCNFHDVVNGSITVPSASTGTTGVGLLAGVGFDEASGLGSMNVNNIANSFATVNQVATTTTFKLSPAAGITHGAAQTLTAQVTAVSGTPTGDISLVAETTNPSGPRLYTLTGGSFTGPVGNQVSVDGYGDTVTSALPAGSYNVHVHYAGDTNFAPSDSASIPVTIGMEASTVASTSYSVANTTALAATSTYTYAGPAVYVATQLSAASGNGVPQGTITYALQRNGTSLPSIVVNIDGSGAAYFYAGLGYPVYNLKPNYVQLSPGSYVLTTSYSGSSTYTASSTTNTFTVGQAATAATFTAPAGINSGDTTTLSFNVPLPVIAAAPNPSVAFATGTVTFQDSTTSSNLGSCTLSSGSCTFTTTAITKAGANSLVATYSGDVNYAPTTAMATTTVGGLTAPTVTLTGTATTAATVGYVYTLRATLNPTTATGTVAFYDGSLYLGSCTLATGTCTLPLGVSGTAATGTMTGGVLTAGAHAFSAVYSGSTTNSASTGTLSTTIAQSTTTLTFSGPADSTYGQPVVVSAYITRSAATNAAPSIPLTGTFSVTDSVTGTVVATGAPVYDPGGYGYYAVNATVVNLTAGAHTLTATYSGDANYKASTAALSVVITVAKLTPAVIVTAPSVVYSAGSSVTLTATIPVSAALAAPTGGLTFYDGSTSLGTANLTYNAAAMAYTATLSTTTLSRGVHSLTAVLGSDNNYNQAAGALTVTVNTNNVWVGNGNGTTSGLNNAGGPVTPSGVNGGGTAVAIDNSGNVWSLSKGGNSVTKLTNTGATVATYIGNGSLIAPSALAIDGAGLVWIANGQSTLTGLTAAGNAIAAKPYATSYSNPVSINVDASGNLWVANSGDDSISETIGIATPVITPQTTAVKNATPAAKP